MMMSLVNVQGVRSTFIHEKSCMITFGSFVMGFISLDFPIMSRSLSLFVSLIFLGLSLCPAQPIDLTRDSRVVWIGNTLAERMQYFGEVETQLHARFPEHKLVVRNLAWPADTVSLRPRPADFGDVHSYLEQMRADVVLACFGFNEIWDYDGEAGVERFRNELASFLKEIQGKNYNGKSAPQIVLYSPIACEGKAVPEVEKVKKLLALYTKVMREVAKERGVSFVDLFTPSKSLFGNGSELKHTINGMHLTADGYAKMAPAFLDAGVFGKSSVQLDEAQLNSLKAEVMEKNDTFFEWFRTVNSLYIHGERKGPHGFFKNERIKLLQMTAIRDQRVWDAAVGRTLPVEIDDSSTVEIRSTFGGRRSGISKALAPEEEYAKFEIGEDFKVELFASEREFPELRNPVSINFDAQGRLWVATMPTYPHAFPGIEPNDQLIILEDTDGDGKADKRSVWADHLYLPLGFEFGGEGEVYVSQEPNLVLLKDTDKDGKADEKTILFHGFGSEDSHHAIHAFVWGPGGGLYMTESTFHNTQVETNRGPVRTKNNAVFRLDPRTDQFNVVCRMPSGGNPWGHSINKWGEHLFIGRPLNVGLINQPKLAGYFATNAPNDITNDTRFCGQEFITSRHWPEELQGKVFSNRYKDLQGVLVHDWTEDGTSFKHNRIAKVFEAHNKACIPVDLQLGPDGALYVADWYNPVLGHMQYSLRHEMRDSKLGRIWRITHKDRPLDQPAKVAGASVEELLENLKAYENRTRYRTRRELWNLPDETLRPALKKWLVELDASHEELSLHLLEGLWLHQQRGWINEELFDRVAKHSDYRARAAAAHLLRFWFDELPQAKEKLLTLASDEHMKVRHEAVVSCTWVDPSVAVEVLEIVNELPQDKNLKLAYGYVVRALKPVLEKHPMMMPTAELAKLPLSDQVISALIRRPGLDRALREKALKHLVGDQGTRSKNLAAIISDVGARGDESLSDWIALFNEAEPKNIAASKSAVEQLLQHQVAVVRQAGYAAMLRGRLIDRVPDEPDFFRSIVLLDQDELKLRFLASAISVLDDSKSSADLKNAALFALGRIPGNDASIFEKLTSQLGDQNLSASAAEALLARGIKRWPLEKVEVQLAKFLPALEKTAVTERGSEAFQQSSKLLKAFAEIVKNSEAAKRIEALQLRPAKIASVPDKLKFDCKTFTVTAGTPVELDFDNPDAIPHNVVICRPGSLEKVGLAVDALLSDPKAMERDWIPEMPEVLFATPMAQLEEAVVTRFMAPEEPGRYPFLCTVPGHWRVMQGEMIVVEERASPTKNEKPNVLILTGEPEYGSRGTLGAFGKKLREEEGMEVTHIHVEKQGEEHHFPGLAEAMAKADVVLFYLRFLNLKESDYQALDNYLSGPKSFICIRTSTHLFDFPRGSKRAAENRAFPDRHFGTPYRGHHGHQTSQLNYVMIAQHPVMKGVEPRFWTPDFVYAANPISVPATPLMLGQGLKGTGRAEFKETVPGSNHVYVLSERDEARVIGTPHPVVWTVDSPDGKERSLVSTIGARKSFSDPNVQRLYLNAVKWCLGAEE